MAGEMEAYSDALAQFKNVKSEIATIADFIINFDNVQNLSHFQD